MTPLVYGMNQTKELTDAHEYSEWDLGGDFVLRNCQNLAVNNNPSSLPI